jgi:FixJ family two-component response regulator
VMDSPIVYVVEDDVSVRQSLENWLRSVGYQVASFASAEAFLRAAARLTTRSGCLVLDVRLPGLRWTGCAVSPDGGWG